MSEERRRDIDEEIHGEQPSGLKGGSYAAPATPYIWEQAVEQGYFLKDRIRWGSVWAGLVIALTVQVLLSALGAAFGLRSLVPTPGNISEATATTFGVWMAVSAIVALFLGGLATARFAGIAGTNNGVWNGVVLWALTIAIGTFAASVGAGSALSSFFGGAGPTAATPGEVHRALGMASAGAGWFVLGSLLGLLAAALGGAVGARVPAEESTQPNLTVT
jgi:hypothetical protein